MIRADRIDRCKLTSGSNATRDIQLNFHNQKPSFESFL